MKPTPTWVTLVVFSLIILLVILSRIYEEDTYVPTRYPMQIDEGPVSIIQYSGSPLEGGLESIVGFGYRLGDTEYWRANLGVAIPFDAKTKLELLPGEPTLVKRSEVLDWLFDKCTQENLKNTVVHEIELEDLTTRWPDEPGKSFEIMDGGNTIGYWTYRTEGGVYVDALLILYASGGAPLSVTATLVPLATDPFHTPNPPGGDASPGEAMAARLGPGLHDFVESQYTVGQFLLVEPRFLPFSR